jgi:hypothetical protein
MVSAAYFWHNGFCCIFLCHILLTEPYAAGGAVLLVVAHTVASC